MCGAQSTIARAGRTLVRVDDLGGRVDVDMSRVLAEEHALEAQGVACEVSRVLHEHCNSHGADTPGHWGDVTALGSHLLEADIPRHLALATGGGAHNVDAYIDH